MKILKSGNMLLKRKCIDVCFEVDDLPFILVAMKQVFSEYPRSQGLSANQLGILKRVAIMRNKGREFFIINPQIKATIGGHRMSVESCLSTDKYEDRHDYYKVKRPRWIVVSYYDENQKQHIRLISSSFTRAFCHEIDHMDGKLITDEGRFYHRCKIVS